MPRVFHVRYCSLHIAIVGALLCMLLLSNTSKLIAYRFLVWTAIGQIIYFSYGFWHSEGRSSVRNGDDSNSKDFHSNMEIYVLDDISSNVQLTEVSDINTDKDDGIIQIYC